MVHPGDQGGVSFLPDPENFKEGGSKMMKRLFCVLAIVTGLILAAGCGNVLAGENLSFSTFDEAVEGLNTPDKVLSFMQKNFSNSFHEGIVSYSPEEFFRIRSGDGKDYATFFSYILSRHDYEADLVIIVWEGKDGKKGAFSTTLFKDGAGVKWFQASDKKSGPVTSLEDMLEKIDTDLKDRKVVGHWVLPPGSMDHRKPEGTAAAGSRGESESYATFEEAVKGLDSPQKVFSYMRNNFSFKYHSGAIAYAPGQLFTLKKGDCKDFSSFFSHILQKHGYYVEMVGFTFYQKDNKRQGHVVAIYKDDDGQLWYQSNFDRLGPVKSVKDLLKQEGVIVKSGV